jgi:hypothetical protein
MEAGRPDPTPLFWPVTEACNDLRRPNRAEPQRQPRSLRENPLLHRCHFASAPNTSAIGLLDLTVLRPGLFNHGCICWLRLPAVKDDSYVRSARSAAIHPFLLDRNVVMQSEYICCLW